MGASIIKQLNDIELSFTVLQCVNAVRGPSCCIEGPLTAFTHWSTVTNCTYTVVNSKISILNNRTWTRHFVTPLSNGSTTS
jgi:hypothetical protein